MVSFPIFHHGMPAPSNIIPTSAFYLPSKMASGLEPSAAHVGVGSSSFRHAQFSSPSLRTKLVDDEILIILSLFSRLVTLRRKFPTRRRPAPVVPTSESHSRTPVKPPRQSTAGSSSVPLLSSKMCRRRKKPFPCVVTLAALATLPKVRLNRSSACTGPSQPRRGCFGARFQTHENLRRL